MKKAKLLPLVCILLLSGCVTKKGLTYFQGINKELTDSINAVYKPQTEAKAQIGDVLFISVHALDAEAAAPYNLPSVIYTTPQSQSLSTTSSLQCYTIAPDGSIDFPVLGKIQINGLYTSEIKNKIEQLLQDQIVNPEVTVNILNQTVSVLGEVNKPGKYAIENGRLTLHELFAQAGDLTLYGKRENIIIAREVNGKMEYGRVDLRSADVYLSPYYFLQPNDVVYVAPNSVRAIQGQNLSLWLSMVSTLASAATVIVTVINTTK